MCRCGNGCSRCRILLPLLTGGVPAAAPVRTRCLEASPGKVLRSLVAGLWPLPAAPWANQTSLASVPAMSLPVAPVAESARPSAFGSPVFLSQSERRGAMVAAGNRRQPAWCTWCSGPDKRLGGVIRSPREFALHHLEGGGPPWRRPVH